ncbi:DUF2829 domain-containing protein [Parendozoicomonas haliclonae]|uniref:Thoeris anti-defense 2-like domain-containing protein n=1 Tax=Parendozoicomonas haliclonae TaxID=1960125 RepID=A0A1X7AE89_9GAMM|nr:DUF2829 domain-containing protein [Parendozoicomonas haliclonae]SMA33352.1 hypothetical protein EHSB41UT_00267 [Parendozoicomonas haliclonae]
MTFGEAIEAIKQGKSAKRSGWNGKGMFIYYVPGGDYKTQTEVAQNVFGETAHYLPYIAFCTAQGDVVPWLASQTDILATDWSIA